MVEKISEKGEKCRLLFPKAKDDVLKYPQPEVIFFFRHIGVKAQEIISMFYLENSKKKQLTDFFKKVAI